VSAEIFAEWDRSLSSNPDTPLVYNKGCQPGYGAEFVAAGQPMAVPYDPAAPSGTWIRCRAIANVTAAAIASETGTSFAEEVGIYTGAVGDTVSQVTQTVKAAIPSWATVNLALVALALGAVAYVVFSARRVL
jgi:hypothetical protein